MDLYNFIQLPFKRILRVHVMIGDRDFGNFLSIKIGKGILYDTVHITNYVPCSPNYSRNMQKILWIPNILRKARSEKRFRTEWSKTNISGLGALFG